MGHLLCVMYTFKCLHNLWLFIHITHTHRHTHAVYLTSTLTQCIFPFSYHINNWNHMQPVFCFAKVSRVWSVIILYCQSSFQQVHKQLIGLHHVLVFRSSRRLHACLNKNFLVWELSVCHYYQSTCCKPASQELLSCVNSIAGYQWYCDRTRNSVLLCARTGIKQLCQSAYWLAAALTV